MERIIIEKIIHKDFGALTAEELKAIINNDDIFLLSKNDKKILKKFIDNHNAEENKDKLNTILKEGLPNGFVILSNLDKYSIDEEGIRINFKESFENNLNRMNILQLCIFLDKLLMICDEFKIRFFRNEEFSLHVINSVVSQSLGLNLAFEIFKPGKYKTFKNINYTWVNKERMAEAIRDQVVRYYYILEIISEIILDTEEENLFKTKINKRIREQTKDYIAIIKKERDKARKTGVATRKMWTYAIAGLTDITVEDDEEFIDWEEDYD